MSEVSLELLNKRAAIAAVRQEAARLGVDGDVLLDSKRLYDQVAALDPDEPGFAGRVREMVGSAAGRVGGRPAAETHQDRREEPRQWTEADVDRATPAEVAEAQEAGLLIDLGYAPIKRRR